MPRAHVQDNTTQVTHKKIFVFSELRFFFSRLAFLPALLFWSSHPTLLSSCRTSITNVIQMTSAAAHFLLLAGHHPKCSTMPSLIPSARICLSALSRLLDILASCHCLRLSSSQAVCHCTCLAKEKEKKKHVRVLHFLFRSTVRFRVDTYDTMQPRGSHECVYRATCACVCCHAICREHQSSPFGKSWARQTGPHRQEQGTTNMQICTLKICLPSTTFNQPRMKRVQQKSKPK